MSNLPFTPRATLVRLLQACLLALTLLLCAPVQAYQVKLPNGEFTDEVVDMRVKVLGGEVHIARTWTNGRWYTNPAWANLRFVADPLDGSVKTIDRSGTFYERSGTSDLYLFEQLFIKKTDTGWRWYTRAGDWVTYDAAGRITAYGDKNDVAVHFTRNAAGEATGITDHLGKPVLTFTYQNDLLTQVTDRTGRSVSYTWTGSGAAARLTKVTDLLSHLWQYEYNGDGQITKRTDPAGGVIDIVYAASSAAGAPAMTSGKTAIPLVNDGVVTTGAVPSDVTLARAGTLTDELRETTVWNTTWDRVARQYTVTTQSPDGRSTVSVYDKDGTLVKKTVNGRQQMLLTRDGANVEKTADERGLTTTTVYDTERHPIQISYPNGTSESFTYDTAHGNKTSHTDEEGILTRWEYDAKGNLTKMIEAAGLPEERTTTWVHDPYGQVLSRTVAGVGGADAATVRFTYEDDGTVKTATDAEEHTTTYIYSYDANGWTIARKDALTHTTTTRYNAAGHRTSVTDALSKTTTYQNDELGRVTEVRNALNQTSKATYNKKGQRLTATDAMNHSTTYGYTTSGTGRRIDITSPGNLVTSQIYDSNGRLMESKDSAGNVTRYEYGAQGSGLEGLLIATVYPTYREEYKYDQRGRRTQVGQILDAQTTLTSTLGYSPTGRLVAETDAGNVTTITQYDGLGRVTLTIDNKNQKTAQTWNVRDNRLTLTDPMENTHRFTYDRNGRVKSEQRPLTGTTSYQYDEAGNLTRRTDAVGNVWAYTYNAVGRKTKATLTGKASSQVIDYGYNDAHQLTNIAQGGETETNTAYTLDDLGRTTAEAVTYGSGDGAITKTVGYGYGLDGNEESLTYPDGTKVQFGYENGQLKSVTLPNTQAITFSGYLWRQPTRIEFPGSTRTITYDALQRPKQIKLANATATLMDRGYTYDRSGNITQRDTEDGAFTYGYDRVNRLTQAAPPPSLQHSAANPNGLPVEAYGYDAVGNRTSSLHQPGEWVYNADNQLLQWGSGTEQTLLTYTANGHTETEAKGGSTRTYIYNAADRLSEVKRDGSPVASYQYDPQGRRISKMVGGVVSYYLYAAEGLIAELDALGNVTQAYGWKPGRQWGTDPLWTAQLTAGQTLATAQFGFVATDHLGTPQVVAGGSGQKVWKGVAEAFGKTSVEAGSLVEMGLRFPGQYFDSESGLHYNWFRGYEPGVGRYIESDPIGLRGGPNLFVYAKGNPTRYSDASGLLPEEEEQYCRYYEKVCEQNPGCTYYCWLAPLACRWVDKTPTYWHTTDEQVKCIRRCLVRRDAEERQEPGNVNCAGCTLDEVIDRYHIDCFIECDTEPCRYPGVNVNFPCRYWDPPRIPDPLRSPPIIEAALPNAAGIV